MNQLVKKYDIQGPRYTSFPPVPFWSGAPGLEQWISDIRRSYDSASGVDLYIHVPYCYSICHYCGCNRVEAEDNSGEAHYVEMLLREWESYREELGNIVVNSVHFGGGTPTFLSPESFDRILSEFKSHSGNAFIGSVELHPNVSSKEHLLVFKKHGINRLSIGVQDLNDQVLKSVNRNATIKDIVDLYQMARELKFESINFDLIYGLPHQTLESMKRTFEQVVEYRPDMIAYYSFAYVPWKMSNQKKIDEAALPGPELKKELFHYGSEILKDAGYHTIGLDHFALDTNFLGKAMLNKTLKRNFMGYVDQKSNITLGLGPSAISNTPYSFAQNQKTIERYYQSIERTCDVPRFINGHGLSDQDQKASQIIHDIMCNGIADISSFEMNVECFEEMKRDGLLDISDNKIVMTPVGMPFVRNVAMKFDHYLGDKKNDNMFSKTV